MSIKIQFTPVVENYKRDNLCWNGDNIYFPHHTLFVSPFVTGLKTTRSAFPNASLIICDSGGYQLVSGAQKSVNWHTVLRYQERIGDINLTLDLPPRAYKGNNHPDIIFEKFLKESVKNANSMMSKKEKEKMRTYAVLHGTTTKTLTKWYRAITKDNEYDGFAMPISLRGQKEITNFIEQLQFVKRLDTNFHFLGNCTQLAMLMFSRLAHLSKKQYTFDSSTVANALVYGQYIEPDYHQKYNFTKNEMHRINFDIDGSPPCDCPVCRKHTIRQLIYNPYLTLNHNIYVIKNFTNNTSTIVQDDAVFYKWLKRLVWSHPTTHRFAEELIKEVSRIL